MSGSTAESVTIMIKIRRVSARLGDWREHLRTMLQSVSVSACRGPGTPVDGISTGSDREPDLDAGDPPPPRTRATQVVVEDDRGGEKEGCPPGCGPA